MHSSITILQIEINCMPHANSTNNERVLISFSNSQWSNNRIHNITFCVISCHAFNINLSIHYMPYTQYKLIDIHTYSYSITQTSVLR